MLLEKGLSESLAGGRFEEIRMSHWSYKGNERRVQPFVAGIPILRAYPGAVSLIGDYERFQQYIQSAIIDSTINKDILMDTPVGKPALLKRQTF